MAFDLKPVGSMGCPNNCTRYTFPQRRPYGLELQQLLQHLVTSILTTSSEARQLTIHLETAQGRKAILESVWEVMSTVCKRSYSQGPRANACLMQYIIGQTTTMPILDLEITLQLRVDRVNAIHAHPSHGLYEKAWISALERNTTVQESR